MLHRQQAQFDRARWRMAILLPCWTLQLLLMLVITAIFAWRLASTVDQEDNGAASNMAIPELMCVHSETWAVIYYANELLDGKSLACCFQ